MTFSTFFMSASCCLMSARRSAISFCSFWARCAPVAVEVLMALYAFSRRDSSLRMALTAATGCAESALILMYICLSAIGGRY